MRNLTFRLRERLKCAGGEPPPVSHQEVMTELFFDKDSEVLLSVVHLKNVNII